MEDTWWLSDEHPGPGYYRLDPGERDLIRAYRGVDAAHKQAMLQHTYDMLDTITREREAEREALWAASQVSQ